VDVFTLHRSLKECRLYLKYDLIIAAKTVLFTQSQVRNPADILLNSSCPFACPSICPN
jgi:hypothetical protein